MARARTYATEGVVLKHMRLGEADRVITLYTPGRGKLRAVVKGARRARSRKGGFLQPISHVRVSIAEGRALDHVAEAETVTAFRAIREDLVLTSTALYFAELVDAFSSEGSVNPAEYHLLVEALGALERGGRPDTLARYFEARILRLAGFGPEMERCVECGAGLAQDAHTFSCAAGGLVGPECRHQEGGPLIRLSMNAIKALRHCQGADAAQALELRLSSPLLAELRRALSAYLAYVLEREPRSAALMHRAARA